jgi:two-component system nitrate/nitrite response regulator NarL
MPQRILIAEDNPAVRNALRTLLEGAGYWEILEVENGQQAIAKAPELKPNLIILDLVMPVMDGLNAARQISKLLPDTPMVMYTMHWSPQVEVEAQKVGVRSVVAKSDSSLLVSTVQQLLAPESSSSQAATSPTATPDIPIPDAAPVPPVLENGSAVPSDKPAESSSEGTTDAPGNRPVN